MNSRLFTLLAAVSLLLCMASAGAWVRARSHFDAYSYTTSPYENDVQHEVGFSSSYGQLLIRLNSNYQPRLLTSTFSGQEEFDENWGGRNTAADIATEPWELYSPHGVDRPSWLGFSVYLGGAQDVRYRAICIPYYFLFTVFAAMPCLWVRRRWARGKIDRRRRRGLCIGCGYDLRTSPARCPECGLPLAVVGQKKATRDLLSIAVLTALLMMCGAIAIFWQIDSRKQTGGMLTADDIVGALRLGMAEHDVDILTNRPHSTLRNGNGTIIIHNGDERTTPLQPSCTQLSDGSTLVCIYDEVPTPNSSIGGQTLVLKSFLRLRFEELKPLLPADLFPAVRMIHLAPSGVANTFDPVALIRAVNSLQALGKPKAIAALRAYVSLARGDSERAFRYDIDERRAELIARILFEWPGELSPANADLLDPNTPGAWPKWPLFVQDDIPFYVDCQRTFRNDNDDRRRGIEAFDSIIESCGPMRSAPLSPACSPFEASETLSASRRWAGRKLNPEGELAKRTLLRIQAIRASAPCVRHLKNENWTCLQLTSKETSDRIWSHFLRDDHLDRLRWDSTKQRFVVPDR